MGSEIKKNLRRRTEDTDDAAEYWRSQAGWYDDDISMTKYNDGVYDKYYQLDDDAPRSKSSGTSIVEKADSQGLSTSLKVGAVVVAVGVAILVYRALAGRRVSAKDRSSSTRKGTSDDTKSRSRSKSASRSRSSRSRSRSRRPGASGAGGNYDLMDEKSEARSRKTSRSRSRSRKAGSSRSRSKSKNRLSTVPILPPAIKAEEKILV